MATEGTAFPRTLDPPIDVTLSDDFIDPEHINTVDARVRAVEAKVGANGSDVRTTLDWRTRHLSIAVDTMTTDADYVTLWSGRMTDGSGATVDVTVVGVRDGANEVIGAGFVGTFRCKASVVSLAGRLLTKHDQRTLLATADVLLEVDGADGIRLRVKSNVADRVHWTARGEVITARPGGM